MSQPELIKHLEKEYQSVSEVISGFEWLENYFFGHDDLRGVFTTAYLHITRSINSAFGSNTFLDDDWTRSYLTRFANLYREAVLGYENQNNGLVPKSWLTSFELAKNKEGLIIYEPFWHSPLQGWINMEEDFEQLTIKSQLSVFQKPESMHGRLPLH